MGETEMSANQSIELMEVMEKIKDEKLKQYLEVYAQNKNPQYLFEILKHFNIEIKKDSIDAIIPYFKVIPDEWSNGLIEIYLGSIILNGNFFEFVLKVCDNGIAFVIDEIKRFIVGDEEICDI
jgi:hypothetical protein